MTAFMAWTEGNGPGNGTDPDLKRPKTGCSFPSKGEGETSEAGRWKKPGRHKRKRMRGWISRSRPAGPEASAEGTVTARTEAGIAPRKERWRRNRGACSEGKAKAGGDEVRLINVRGGRSEFASIGSRW